MSGGSLGHLGIVVSSQEHQAAGIEAGMGGRYAPHAGIRVTRQLGNQGPGQIRVIERTPATVRVEVGGHPPVHIAGPTGMITQRAPSGLGTLAVIPQQLVNHLRRSTPTGVAVRRTNRLGSASSRAHASSGRSALAASARRSAISGESR